MSYFICSCRKYPYDVQGPTEVLSRSQNSLKVFTLHPAKIGSKELYVFSIAVVLPEVIFIEVTIGSLL